MKVKVLKPFGQNNIVVHPGDEIDITAHRHADLARNGLVTPPKDEPAEPAAKGEFGVIKSGSIAAKPRHGRKITGA